MAKSFKFRLEPVLRLRSHKVEESKRELRNAANRRRRKEEEIEEKEIYLAGITKAPKGLTKASELQAGHFHKVYIREELKKLDKEKLKLIGIETEKRDRLNDDMKDEKILIKLKEKQLKAYEYDAEREDVIRLDEIARNLSGTNDILKV
jgi:flagellar export protein FliJ